MNQVSITTTANSGISSSNGTTSSPTIINTSNNTNSNNTSGVQRSIPECQGCLSQINDRYYLQVMDRCWHLNCLRCVDCKLCLDTQQSCFTKDGFIYCKDDYHK